MTALPDTILEESGAIEATSRLGSRAARSVAALLARPAVHQGAFALADQAVVSATNFITAWAIARTCSQGELGVYYLAFAIVLFVRGIQEQVISVPYTVYSNRHRGDSLALYTGSTLVYQFVLSATAVLGLLGLAGLGAGGVAPAWLKAAVWVVLAALPAFLLRDYLRYVSLARLRPLAAVAMDAVVAALQLGGIVALVCYDAMSVPAVYVIVGVACASGAAGWFLLAGQPLRIAPARTVSDWRRSWSFSRCTLASQLLASCTPHLLPWILASVHGAAAAGLLGACGTLIGLSYMFVTGVTNFLMPKAARAFARGGADELWRVLKPAACMFFVVLGTFCTAVALAGNWLPAFVYGDQFASAGALATLLALSILTSSFGVVAGCGLLAMERPGATFRADVYSVAAMLAAAVCLIPPLGALGAAIAMLISSTSSMAIRVVTLWRVLQESGRPQAAALPWEARA